MTESYRRSGDEMPQDRPYAYGSPYGTGHGSAPGAYGGGDVPPPPYVPGMAEAGAPAAPEPRRRARRPVALIAAVALASGLIGGGSAALIAGATQQSSTSGGVATPLVNAGQSTGSGTGVAGVAKAVSPAIVEIKAQTADGESTGSGVVITSNGEIVTNNHVVSGSRTVSVTFSDGSKKTATVVGTDPDKDLALIKVTGGKGLTHAVLGDSSKLVVGDPVVAIGSPEGLTGSVTSGIVSALNRDVTVPKEGGQSQDQGQGQGRGRGSFGGGGWPFEFGGNQYNGDTGSSKTTYKAIQTDAALNPGNSGGALINMQGQIVGINAAMYSPSSSDSSQAGSVGLGFAIPINTVKADLDALRGGGSGGGNSGV
ncbi:S1C family serine protease [Streptomyces sp. NPDC093097]|uniref:S1C family serine protease n=1 Tax=Streptomyces sp. NPDC093097 TaxID=3366027 RepID=UPI0038185AEB